MIVYEIENMETHEKAYVQCASEQFMISELKHKGFTEIPGMFLAAYNDKGEEIIAMETKLPHVSSLEPIRK